MVKYKPKYFKISSNESNNNKYFLKVFFIIFISIIIFIIIIITCYNIFISSPLKLQNNKIDTLKIKNDLKLYYISGKYYLIKDSIENILFSYKLQKDFQKDLLLFYFHVCYILNDFLNIEKYLEQYKKLFNSAEIDLIYSLIYIKKGELNRAKETIEKSLRIKKVKNKKLNIENFYFNFSNIYNLEAFILYLNILNIQKNYIDGENLIKALKIHKNYDVLTSKLNLDNYKIKTESLINFNIEYDIRVYFDINLAYFLYMNGKFIESLDVLLSLVNRKILPQNERKINFLISNIYYYLEKNKESKEYLNKSYNFGLDLQTYYYNYLINIFEENIDYYKNNPNTIIINDLEIKKELLFDPFIYAPFSIILYLNNMFEKVIVSFEHYKMEEYFDRNYNLELYNNFLFYIEFIYLDSFFKYYSSYFLSKNDLKEKLLKIADKILKRKLNNDNFIIFSRKYLEILIYLDQYDKFNSFIIENINLIKQNIDLVELIMFYNIKKNNFVYAYNFLQNYFDRKKDIFYFYYFYSLIELFEKNDINSALKTISNLEDVKLEEKERDKYYFYKAFLNYLSNKREESYNVIKKIRAFDGESAIFYMFILLKLEKFDEILKFYDKFKEINFQDPMIYFFYGVALYKFERYEESANYFLYLLENNVGNKIKSYSCTYLGNIYYYLNKIDTAMNFYQEALLYDKENLTIKNNLNLINKK